MKGRRNRAIIVGVVAGLGAVCGAGFGVHSWRAHHERSRHDRTVRSYLQALSNGDYDAAYALVCTDETGTDMDSFLRSGREARVRSFQVDTVGDWSSWVDGHGRVYRVHITRAPGVEAVERITTEAANGGCVQYALIRDE